MENILSARPTGWDSSSGILNDDDVSRAFCFVTDIWKCVVN